MVLSSLQAEVGLRPPEHGHTSGSCTSSLPHQWILDKVAVMAEGFNECHLGLVPTLGSSQILSPLSEPSSRHIFT